MIFRSNCQYDWNYYPQSELVEFIKWVLQNKVSPLTNVLQFQASFLATQTLIVKLVFSNVPSMTKAFRLMADDVGEL